MLFAIVLMACCDGMQATQEKTFGGGSASIAFQGTDTPVVAGEAVGVSADAASGPFADGESGSRTNVTLGEGDEPPGFREGMVYVQVCVDLELAECGPATACFYSGWLAGTQLDGSAHPGRPTLTMAYLGRDASTVPATVTVDSEVSGTAEFEAPVWEEDADACLATFQPTGATVSWAFDAEALDTRDFGGGCG